MKISIMYEIARRDRRVWSTETKTWNSPEASAEALNKFFQWAVDNKVGAIILMMLFDENL